VIDGVYSLDGAVDGGGVAEIAVHEVGVDREPSSGGGGGAGARFARFAEAGDQRASEKPPAPVTRMRGWRAGSDSAR